MRKYIMGMAGVYVGRGKNMGFIGRGWPLGGRGYTLLQYLQYGSKYNKHYVIIFFVEERQGVVLIISLKIKIRWE